MIGFQAQFSATGFLLMLGSSAISAPALAQEGPGPLEEVLVTAQKREQRLTEVPVPMQAFTNGQITASSLRDLSQLLKYVPGASEGLSITLGQRQYQLRGIASNSRADPTLGYYIDDAAFFIYGEPYAPVGRTFDMARVEVLRGPQSTLYGNGSMGGTVRYITEPADTSDVSGQLRAAWADTRAGDSSYWLDGAVNLPIVRDRLALRLVGSRETVGGYHRDIDGNRNTNEGEIRNMRASLLWEPADTVSVKFLYNQSVADQDGSSTLVNLDPPIATAQPGDFNDRDYELFAGTLSWETAIGSFSSTTTYIDHNTEALFNSPFPLAPGGVIKAFFTTTGEALNNETRLVSNHKGPTQWLAGIFYSDTESSQNTKTNISEFLPDSVQEFDSRALSLFGEISREFMDGKLVPLLGLRYFEDDRKTSISTAGSQPGKRTFDSWNPRFNLSFMPDERSNYFLNVAKGFRSGNFNNPDVCAFHRRPLSEGGGGLPCADAVESDELWSYEVGAKLMLLNNQLSVDAALYFQDWRDMRQSVQVRGLFQDYQVGDAEIYGIDLGLAWVPRTLQGFNFSATANWNSAEFASLDTDIIDSTGTQTGDRLPLVPEWTFSLISTYYWSLRGAWVGQATLGYSHIDSQNGQFGTSDTGDPRDLLRARIGADNDNLGIWLFGNNLLKENGAIYVQNPSAGLSFLTQDYPRQLGIEVSYSF